MAWKSNMTDAGELADRLITLYSKTFVISAANTLTNGLPSLATFKEGILGKTESFTIYSKLTKQTSALTEDTEATPEAMADSAVTITPAEYGNVCVHTTLVKLQSGGMSEIANFELAGINMRESIENKMILTGEAGSNEIIVTQSAEASLTASDTLTAAYVKRAHNKLARAGIPKPYYAVAHDDVIYDLKIETGSGAWTDVNMYTDSMTVLNNEIGMFGGFRWISSPLVTVNTDAGASAVDTYHSQFFGQNAFGYVESQTPDLVVTPPSDNLSRFMNIGWYGVYEFGLVDTNAHYLVTSASSIGTNT
jgi:N4-gp56 family major capsid protein